MARILHSSGRLCLADLEAAAPAPCETHKSSDAICAAFCTTAGHRLHARERGEHTRWAIKDAPSSPPAPTSSSTGASATRRSSLRTARGHLLSYIQGSLAEKAWRERGVHHSPTAARAPAAAAASSSRAAAGAAASSSRAGAAGGSFREGCYPTRAGGSQRAWRGVRGWRLCVSVSRASPARVPLPVKHCSLA